MLADEFIKIDKLDEEYRSGAYEILYKFNPRFTQYADLCYNMDATISTEGLPKITYDDAPMGMHPTHLEMIYKDFKAVVYNPNLDSNRVMQRFLQMCESIDKVEVDFLKQVIDGELRWFPYQDWKALQPVMEDEELEEGE